MTESAETESEEPHDTVGGDLNVVLVILDTARSKSVDSQTMPTLSALADEGTTFENAFAAAPWTLPSHASLFTGTYPTEHGAHGGHTYLDSSFRTLAEAFFDAGYETIGVSNNTWITEEFGFDRGFEQLRRGWQYIQSPTDMGTVVRAEHPRAKLEAARDRLFEGNPAVNMANLLYSELIQPTGDDGADRATKWAGNWLANRTTDRPFFLFCNYIEPHIDYSPPRQYAEQFLPDSDEYDDSYEAATAIRQDPRAYDVGDYEISEAEFDLLRALYRGELRYVDDQIAALREHLIAAGEWEDTVIVVCGDHGENVGEYGFFGHQYNLYDTLLHVPLVIHGGPFTDGGRRTELVSLLDLPTTLLEAAGIDDPELREQSRGQSLGPEPALGTTVREAVFAEYVAPQPSIELLENRFGTLPERVYGFDRRLRAIRTSEYKYVEGDDGFRRLHDRSSDLDERENIADSRPEKVATLSDRLRDQFEDVAVAETTESVSMTESTKDRLADLGYL